MGQIYELAPWLAVIVATLLCWLMTAFGAALVFCVQQKRGRWLDAFMAFGAGVMLAASIWSLLIPSLEQESDWKIPALAVLLGGAVILTVERCLDFSGILKCSPSQKRSFLLVLAVTLHNIPEGMAVGLAFCAENGAAPWLLALGIALQNFPEGAAVSLPLHRDGVGRWKSFLYGQASGFVEPLAAVGTYFLSENLENMLPFLMAFSAGAMLTVVAGELLPEAVEHSKFQSVSGFLMGFLLMMVLDVALG